MRISLNVGTKRYHLAGQPGVSERVHSSAGNYRKSATSIVQASARFRAKEMQLHDRGNVQTTISFSTTRKFTDAAEAMAWGHDHEQNFPREGNVAVESPRGNGSSIVRYLDNAVVSPPEISYLGATLIIFYTITGGIFRNK